MDKATLTLLGWKLYSYLDLRCSGGGEKYLRDLIPFLPQLGECSEGATGAVLVGYNRTYVLRQYLEATEGVTIWVPFYHGLDYKVCSKREVSALIRTVASKPNILALFSSVTEERCFLDDFGECLTQAKRMVLIPECDSAPLWTPTLSLPITLGYLGQNAERKRLPDLIRVIDQWRLGRSINLLIAGPRCEHLHYLTYNRPWVRIEGELSPSDLRYFWERVDIHVSLSRHEAFSIVTASALASGREAIASESAGLVSYVPEGTLHTFREIGDVPHCLDAAYARIHSLQQDSYVLQDQLERARRFRLSIARTRLHQAVRVQSKILSLFSQNFAKSMSSAEYAFSNGWHKGAI